MIKVYFLKINKKHYKHLDVYLKALPVVIKKRLFKLDQKDDRFRGVIARLILKKILIVEGYSENVLKKIKIDEYNRPYLDNKIDFNISHSGNYVLCAICTNGAKKTRVGVDIEKMRKIKIDEFNVFLSKTELVDVLRKKRPLNRYFELWTKKEAVSKANGKGIGTLLPGIKIKNKVASCENIKWNLKKININKNYQSHLAFKGNPKIKIIELKTEEIF